MPHPTRNTKTELLQLLRAAPGQFISGQALADRLGRRRAAVHKAAQALQRQGWALEAVSRRGYRLAGAADRLCPEVLGPYPAPADFYESPDRPHTVARQRAWVWWVWWMGVGGVRALCGAPHGTLVVAGTQTAGRGRLGRSFESPAGKGLYMTILLRPQLAAPQALAVTGSAAVAVCRAVQAQCGLPLAIKWVNDLFYNGKKVCGILTEAVSDLDTGMVDHLAVGIGLNLTATAADFAPGLWDTAGSLYPGGACPAPRAQLAGAIARELLALCPDFDYLAEYRARCFVPGHWVMVREVSGETYTARALAIDDAGRLVVETAAGRRTALSHAEVSVKPARP